MTELSSTPLALTKTNLHSFATTLKENSDHVLAHVTWKTANKNGLASLWAFFFGFALARSISFQRLVLRIVHSDGDTLEQGTRHLRSLVHGLSVVELHVSEVTIPQLVHLQTDHFNLTTRLKEFDDILLRRVDGEITKPEGAPSWRFRTLGLAVQNTARRIGFTLRIGHHFVHVGIVDLNSASHERLALLLCRLIHARRVFELHMCKVAADLMVTDAHVCHTAAVLEEFNDVILRRSVWNPTHPDRSAAFGLRLSTPDIAAASRTPATPPTALRASVGTVKKCCWPS
mmetsp:Transcript_12322/g.33886  ORF Transcript_12322/g.33886 Transcript_12322/m.33886 type:complete len:287 (+) Transcript_12322:646-1506(+)